MTVLTAIQAIGSKVSIALITIFIGFIIAKLASRIAKKVMAEAELNRILVKAGFKPLSEAIGYALEYLIYTITILVVLHQFGLTTIVLAIIAALALLAILFSILLAARDFIPNALVGLFIRRKTKRHIGKKVQIGSVKGKLEHFGITASVVKDKEEHYVPHIYTHNNKITRLRAN